MKGEWVVRRYTSGIPIRVSLFLVPGTEATSILTTGMQLRTHGRRHQNVPVLMVDRATVRVHDHTVVVTIEGGSKIELPRKAILKACTDSGTLIWENARFCQKCFALTKIPKSYQRAPGKYSVRQVCPKRHRKN